MEIRKPIITKKKESMTLIKQIKTKRRTKITPPPEIEANTLSSFDDSISETAKPILINYQAIPISVFHK